MKYLNDTGLAHLWANLKTLLQGKQDKLTAGAGINIDANNVISASGSGGSNGLTLTKTYTGTLLDSLTFTNNKYTVQTNASPSASAYPWMSQTLQLYSISSSDTVYNITKLYNAASELEKAFLRFTTSSGTNIEGWYTVVNDDSAYGFVAEDTEYNPIYCYAVSKQYKYIVMATPRDIYSQINNKIISKVSVLTGPDTIYTYNLSTAEMGDGINIRNNDTLILEPLYLKSIYTAGNGIDITNGVISVTFSNVEEGTY